VKRAIIHAVALYPGFNFSSDNLSSADQTVLTYHIIAEAFKFAYARRAELGDESFVNVTEVTPLYRFSNRVIR
jgi:gamma-glutamyltranspeptidase